MLAVTLSESQLSELAIMVSKHLAKVMNTDENEVLISKDVLKICHITKPTLFAWRSSGKLPHKKVGSKFYYQKKDVMALTMPSK